MTRAFAALLLLCFAWSQAFAADCPLAAPAGTDAAAHAGHAGHAGMTHGGHAHASTTSTRTEHAPRQAPAQHHRAGCVLAMACGAPALPHHVSESADLRQPTAGATWPARTAYLSPVLGSDPPPPRLA
jgi:hypothetical protein